MNTMSTNRERELQVHNGWVMLPIVIALMLGSVAVFVLSIAAAPMPGGIHVWLAILAVLTEAACVVMLVGFFTLQPNEARVIVLFGEYKGTVRKSGFYWGNPFYSNGSRGSMAQRIADAQHAQHAQQAKSAPAQHGKSLSRFKISLRARTLNGDKLKVNDRRGNPVEIAAVVVWRVQDTAQAVFDVDDFEGYVQTQSESALRHLASCYAYDHGEDNEITLRSNVGEVSQALREELHERLAKAGVVVEEARLTHLAYAPEIAQAMLRRQQAEAVIAARRKIVTGAVSMVEMALDEFKEHQTIEFDEERKAAMVSNLMVVLCGESQVTPVVNTGTLYQ